MAADLVCAAFEMARGDDGDDGDDGDASDSGYNGRLRQAAQALADAMLMGDPAACLQGAARARARVGTRDLPALLEEMEMACAPQSVARLILQIAALFLGPIDDTGPPPPAAVRRDGKMDQLLVAVSTALMAQAGDAKEEAQEAVAALFVLGAVYKMQAGLHAEADDYLKNALILEPNPSRARAAALLFHSHLQSDAESKDTDALSEHTNRFNEIDIQNIQSRMRKQLAAHAAPSSGSGFAMWWQRASRVTREQIVQSFMIDIDAQEQSRAGNLYPLLHLDYLCGDAECGGLLHEMRARSSSPKAAQQAFASDLTIAAACRSALPESGMVVVALDEPKPLSQSKDIATVEVNAASCAADPEIARLVDRAADPNDHAVVDGQVFMAAKQREETWMLLGLAAIDAFKAANGNPCANTALRVMGCAWCGAGGDVSDDNNTEQELLQCNSCKAHFWCSEACKRKDSQRHATTCQGVAVQSKSLRSHLMDRAGKVWGGQTNEATDVSVNRGEAKAIEA